MWDQLKNSGKMFNQIISDVKSDRWKSRAEVTYKYKSKVGLCNKKIKIYQTIKGLIILFIKFQFSIRYNQVFRPLCISTSNVYLNIYLNLRLNPNDLIIYIIPNTFLWSLIRLMTPDIHTTEVSMHPIKVRSKFIYLSGLGAISLPTKKPLSFSSLP